MKSIFESHISQHQNAINYLIELKPLIEDSAELIVDCIRNGHKVLLCGNGGSAADAQHIAAELVGRFIAERKGLPAIALTTDTSIITAIANDYGYSKIFSRQVESLAQDGDVFIGISSSGNSFNVIEAAKSAKEIGCVLIGLLGRDGGELKNLVDWPIVIPVQETAAIQECHIIVGHIWCGMVDAVLAL